MKKKIFFGIILYSTALYFYVFSMSQSQVPTASHVVLGNVVETQISPLSDEVSVTRIIDGDTIVVQINNKEEKVRLIGIDTPETVDPHKPVQCFGIEASKETKKLLLSGEVILRNDPTQDNRDIYGRLLRYVYTLDGVFVNKVLLAEGYAHEYTYRTPYQYQTEFKKAEQDARTSGKGLWAQNACSGF